MKRAQRAALEEQAFEASLISAPPRISTEYENDVRRLGPVFEQGDGELGGVFHD